MSTRTNSMASPTTRKMHACVFGIWIYFGFATFAYVGAARKFIQHSSHRINNAEVLAMLEDEHLQVGKSNYSKKLRMEQQHTVNDIYSSCDAHNLRAENRMVHKVWLHKDAGVRKIREIDF